MKDHSLWKKLMGSGRENDNKVLERIYHHELEVVCPHTKYQGAAFG